MMKPVAVALLLALPLLATTASADTTTTDADTLVVVTPNAPVVVQQGGAPGMQPYPPIGSPMPAPGAPATANGAPQNEDWSNVNHINGVPVKVGEKGDYLIRFRKNNITGNPFGLFFGYYDVAFSHALGQNLALSLAVTGWNLSSYEQGYQVAATLPLYFKRTYSGPYLEGGLLMRADTSSDGYAYDCYDCSSMSSRAWVGPELLFGWHWTFDSGLNIQAAFGVAKKMGTDSSNSEDANGYFRVGYAF